MSAGMRATQILEQYRDGKRMPVRGPFTYAEAQRLVALNDKLLAALKDLNNVPFGSGAATLRARSLAHYNAINVIVETESM